MNPPPDPLAKVVISCELPNGAGGRIAGDASLCVADGASRTELMNLVAGAAAIVVDPTVVVDGQLLDAAGARLRLVANFGVGHDHVDLEACRSRGVMVTNTPGVLTEATAELALALTLATARRIGSAEAALRSGRWSDPQADLGVELSGACWGVVGMGRIGTRYAALVRPMAGSILYVGRSTATVAERDLDAIRVDLRELLTRADVVSLHLPGGAETSGLIGRKELDLMKPTAILVNTARGSLIDEEALAAALAEGRIGGAGLDVYAREPEVSRALLGAPRCVLLPHIGSATDRARGAMAELVAGSVRAVLAGVEPDNRVA